ncbi:helix-hairpin-helix domain-containing protein [Luteimonas sp. MC1750]|uniref:ComEA family DNA-binding protein n=1 Tax=Luteimonas sp. MC1750 TaxID=2799326 RepID=UPI0018F0F752|nr:helix-hairpin-helix domain-containing protein [Luteimonas sp. MC1750]MBJ6983616.1 helix-hairpin-helix domain-containing protein [Luteimonas sp. MC1750]QQO06459.1 helix-hairpin-helix domain-containing protein [Luteimonas sp. MC1750]
MKPLKSVLVPVLLSLLAAGSAIASEKVNINTADAATIDRVLVNIGASKAEAIVAHRKANGAFKSADELANVKGVGLKTVERNRDRIVVAGGAAAKPAAGGAKPAPKPAAKRVAAAGKP